MAKSIVVGIVGALTIALAAAGLWVDLDRGAPSQHALQPVAHPIEVHITSIGRVMPAGVGQCIPECPAERTHVTGTLSGPDLGRRAFLELGNQAIGFDGDAFDGTFDGDVAGQPATLRIGDVIGSVPLRTGSHDVGAIKFAPPGTLRLEQIGAVETSLLLDAQIQGTFPEAPTAWLDGALLGEFTRDGDGWRFDERIERLEPRGAFEVRVGDVVVLNARL